MTRREFFALAAAAGSARPVVAVPVRLVIDKHAAPDLLRRFWSKLWPQAVETFGAGGIRLDVTIVDGEVRRSAGGLPILEGLDRNFLNVVVTGHLPMQWDQGRALSGVTTRYQRYYLCMVALHYAHPHQVPFVAVNTCVHEILHAFLQDIFENRPPGVRGFSRETRVDWYATRLWLLHDGAYLRRSAQACVMRLQQSSRELSLAPQ